MRPIGRSIVLVLFAGLLVHPLGAQSGDEIQATRSDFEGERDALVTRFMGLDAEENRAFWPVYRDFRSRMAKIGDRRLKLISDYAENREKLSDRMALRLPDRFLKIEESRLKLKKKYVKEFMKVLPTKKVVRFYHLDNQLDAKLDYNLAGSIPLVK